MGMYDNIKLEVACSSCGAMVSGFQSKDGGCTLSELDYWEVNNFYSSCSKCGLWIEYNRKTPRGKVPLSDYEQTGGYNVVS